MAVRPFTCSSVSILGGAACALGLLAGALPAEAATLSAAAAADLEIEPYIEGLAGPTDVAVLPDGRVVAIERTGNVYTKPLGDGELLEDRIDVLSNRAEQGLLGVVADPDFASNQYLYFYASAGESEGSRHQVHRYKLGADGKLSDMKVVVAMGLRGPDNHNGGALDIYQGNLYIGVGDTGANSSPPTNKFSSCLNIANGKVLRVSLAEATLGQPADDNPLVAEAMVTSCDSPREAFGLAAPEKRVFAWGFRNPFRLWVDRTTGLVWVGDVGEQSREEVSVISKGDHAGYPFWEGTKEWKQDFVPPNGGCMGMAPATACVAPIVDWARGSGGSAIGGRILDGCGWPAAWKSRYIFGDHEQGKVWTIDVNAARNAMVEGSQKDFASTTEIRSLRMGTDNALYLVEGSGTVSRVTAKNTTTTPGSCKAVDGGDSGVGGNGAGGDAGTSPGGSDGVAGTLSGGSPSAGSAGSSAAGGGGNGSSSDGGCGCQVVGGASTSLAGLGALAAALGLALRRRRRAA